VKPETCPFLCLGKINESNRFYQQLLHDLRVANNPAAIRQKRRNVRGTFAGQVVSECLSVEFILKD
jgi:hypothetical protein